MNDLPLLYSAAFLRSLSTGMIAILLGIYLEELDFSAAEIGLVVAAGLGGGAVGSALATFKGDQIGRRRLLLGVTAISALGGIALTSTSHEVVLPLAAFFGMVNGMGRDRGAALILEQAILPGTVTDAMRTRAFAWYNVFQDIGHALGGLLAGLPVLLRAYSDLDSVSSLQWSVGCYALLTAIPIVFYLRLSTTSEVACRSPKPRISPETRRVLWKISSLFGVDSVAGGFLTTALLAYFFYKRFDVTEGVIGLLFFGARVANALSHLGAAWLANRIGLVNTMVFTHIPSSLLLMTVPFAPSFAIAAALFLLREGLVEMDVPTRQSYVMAIVRAEERTVASGVTHLVRLGGWSLGPLLAGLMMQGLALAAPLFVGGSMKILYDVLLYRNFKHMKPPEEACKET